MMAARRVEVIDSIEVRLDPREVRRLLGYVPGRRPPAAAVARRIEEMTAEAGSLLQPRGCYTMRDLPEAPLSGPFRGAERVAFSVCTIGPALERRVAALARADEPLRALVLDAIGSAAVEAVADVVNASICREVGQQGVFTNRRISPGYRGWPIECQAEIFALIPTRLSGVALKPTWFMEPRKSISAAVSVGRGVVHSKYVSICGYCDRRGCAYRRREDEPIEPSH
jgi:hypothetical protein